MRVVIDTNVLISAFVSPRGVPAQILTRFEQQTFELLVSEEILREYAVVLQYDRVKKRHKLNSEQIEQFLNDMRATATVITPTTKLSVIASDPDDNKFFECALAGGAHFIVSGDIAVQTVKNYQEIQILSPTVFLAMLEHSE